MHGVLVFMAWTCGNPAGVLSPSICTIWTHNPRRVWNILTNILTADESEMECLLGLGGS